MDLKAVATRGPPTHPPTHLYSSARDCARSLAPRSWKPCLTACRARETAGHSKVQVSHRLHVELRPRPLCETAHG